jgi:hypothetical protein
MLKPWKELTSVILIFSVLSLFLPNSPAYAGWAPTRAALDGPQARLVSLLEREDVALAFEELGVDRAEAARRVAGLTDGEATLALERLDSIPAGGSVLGAIVGAALVVFLVLLVTDLLGLTNFYKFTRKP